MSGLRAYDRAAADARQHGPVIELQALRGIAALVVVVYHGGLYYDYGSGARSWMTFALNAHAAVVSFFVLSGFVLALSLMRAPIDRREIALFYVRRAFRIYPALWAACALGVAYLTLFGAEGTALGTAWARSNFGKWPISGAQLAAAFAGLKSNLPLPIWSMAIELLASLAMPALIVAMRRSAIGFAMLVAGLAMLSLGAGGGWLLLPMYLVDFAIGAAVALLAPTLRHALAGRGRAVTFALAGLALLWFGRGITGADFEAAYHHAATGLIEAIGAAMLVGAVYVRPAIVPLLSTARAIRLGDHSYSLYLLHQPVLGLVTATGAILLPGAIVAAPGVATLVAIGLMLAVTLPLARLGFHHVELPAIRLGRRVVAAIEAGPDAMRRRAGRIATAR